MPPIWSSPVRFVECDRQGVVFHGHFLVYADEAVNAWWDARGLSAGVFDEFGVEYLVVASSLEWTSPARWGDTVEVDAEPEKVGRSSLAMRFTVRIGERVCCVVRTTYVCVSAGRPTPWPEEFRARIAH